MFVLGGEGDARLIVPPRPGGGGCNVGGNVLCLQAKEKYEREEKRKELKRARGEHTWMLPEVEQQLQRLEQVSGIGWLFPQQPSPREPASGHPVRSRFRLLRRFLAGVK